MNRKFVLAAFVWIVASIFLMAEDFQNNQVKVTGFDESGLPLRDGLGFIYDSQTVVCSYHDVKDAAMVVVQSQGEESHMNQLVRYSDRFDVAILRSEAEIPVENLLGSSDMLARGDKIRFFARRNGTWFPGEGSVLGFVDTAAGYEEIQLQVPPDPTERFEPAPLYDESGRVVGWRIAQTRAISLDTIHHLALNNSAAVSLKEVNRFQKFWPLPARSGSVANLTVPAFSQTSEVQGPAEFPFHVDLPANWRREKFPGSGQYLLRSQDPASGVWIEVRAMSAGPEDFITSIERLETFLFPEFNRSEMIPYSSDYFTGMQAIYEDPAAPYKLMAFYTASGSHLYMISVLYPQKFEENVVELLDLIVSSFRLPS